VKFFLDNWFLFAAALVSGGLLVWPLLSKSAGGSSKVTPAEAVRLINREKAVLIDVSEPAEYAAGHASGSRSVPLAQIDVVVCPTGTRAARAVAALKKAGFENAQALAGGLAAWREANLPVEKTA
jgi:rhodanese-related sulfurtransferase